MYVSSHFYIQMLVLGQSVWYNNCKAVIFKGGDFTKSNQDTFTGARIREQRALKGMTLKNLADKLGVQYQTVQAWESGKRIPKEETIKKIAYALEITADYLAGRTNGPHTRMATQEDIEVFFGGPTYSTKDGVEVTSEPKTPLLQYFSRLNNEGQAVAVERVKELAEIPRYQAKRTTKPTSAASDGKDTTEE